MYFLDGWRGAAFIIVCVLGLGNPIVCAVAMGVLSTLAMPDWMAGAYELDESSLTVKSGTFISFREYKIPLRLIEHVEKNQTLVGSLLGYGNLRITAMGGSQFDLIYVPNINEWYVLLVT
jgi:uncharacterized membrane protein YdbT with pleckstrin-like domain